MYVLLGRTSRKWNLFSDLLFFLLVEKKCMVVEDENIADQTDYFSS